MAAVTLGTAGPTKQNMYHLQKMKSMKKHINHYWLALALLLPALHACHDEDEAMLGDQPGTASTPTVVRASVGNEPDTRAQVKYGTNDPKEGEYFMWNTGDQFTAYNITAAETTPTAYTFNIDDNYNETQPSNQADFSCANGFPATVGNKVAAFYGKSITNATAVTGANGEKGIQVTLTTPTTLTQMQTATPGNADLKHLQQGLCMYALTEAGQNGGVSPLSFRHLSTLFRITLRNNQTSPIINPQIKLWFAGAERFCHEKTVILWENGILECVEDKGKLPMETLSTNATIAPGGSYDFFLPVLLPGDETGMELSAPVVYLNDKYGSVKYMINVQGKPGMRYWFDMTVKADGTFEQTAQVNAYDWYTQNKDAAEFSIYNGFQLFALSGLVNGTDEAKAAAGVSGPVSFEGKTIRLANDISGFMTDWKPIGKLANPFKGTFDGGGHSITGIYFNQYRDDYAGLFGYIDGGTVRNLRVSGRWATTSIYVGGIVGYLDNGSTVENCIFSGEVSGTSNVGGIAAYFMSTRNDNRISGCYTKGKVTATDRNAGGIAGSTISSSINGCYSEAEVTAADRTAGGIAGENANSSFTHCYATGKVSGANYIGGIVGINGSPSSVCYRLHRP